VLYFYFLPLAEPESLEPPLLNPKDDCDMQKGQIAHMLLLQKVLKLSWLYFWFSK